VWFLVNRLHLVVPLISICSIVSCLLIISLSGYRFIILVLNLLFCCALSWFTWHIQFRTEHIRCLPDISVYRLDISDPSWFNLFKLVEFQVWLRIHTLPLGNFHRQRHHATANVGSTVPSPVGLGSTIVSRTQRRRRQADSTALFPEWLSLYITSRPSHLSSIIVSMTRRHCRQHNSASISHRD
jgi:hypothetical protein